MTLFLKKIFRFIYFFPSKIKEFILHKFSIFLLSFTNKFSLFKVIALYLFLTLKTKNKNIGSLWQKATWISVFFAAVGNRFNINHLGNVYAEDYDSLSLTKKIEKQVIEWNKKIINCTDKNIEGYIDSGGTESNLFLMWIGREYLKKRHASKPVLLLSNFTHYSVSKSGRIMDLEFQIVKIDKKNWGIDCNDLEKNFLKFIKKNRFSFLLPITIGYSSTGASDPLNKIVKLVKKLKKEYPKFNCFVWVDAAAQGLPKSFLEKDFNPLSNDLVQGYIVDFHKYGNAPLPSGIVLYRKRLRELIETSIPYLLENDSTILGSRPGSSVLSIWGSIVSTKADKWQERFVNLEKRKNYLIEKLKEKNPRANVLSFNNSLTFAVEINSNFKEFPKEFEDKYSLVKCNINGFRHYKFHIQ